jgi:two-component system response regulator AtoC
VRPGAGGAFLMHGPAAMKHGWTSFPSTSPHGCAKMTARPPGTRRAWRSSMERPLVLVIDDETGSRESMAIAIEKAGLAVRTVDEAKKALEYLDENDGARVAVCDLRMPGMDGLAFLNEVRERKYDLGVIFVTGYGSIESAVEAMRVGADDYLTKPVDLYELRKRVMNLIEKEQLREEVTSLREQLDKRYGFESIIGRSGPMERLFEQMKMVAPTRSSVLVIGESGTGKELVANALHRASPRRNERFLAINCGAIPSDILESELFGHERGAFTGAVSRKIGKFELAHRGTLFLDEISELYPELQVKLLRVLEERQIMRVGGSELLDVDFRLIAATNRDLEKEVAEGRFREDLYYRLKVVTLRIPPLRERPADLPPLAEHFLAAFCQEHGKPGKRLSAEAMEVLARYPWPGNVRELRNVIESAVIFHQGDEIGVADLPSEVRDSSALSASGGPVQSVVGEPRTMESIERQAILETLQRTGGHRARAADLLGIGLRTLQRKLKEYKDQGFYEE